MKIIDFKKDINNFLFEPKLELIITFTADIVSQRSIVMKKLLKLKIINIVLPKYHYSLNCVLVNT